MAAANREDKRRIRETDAARRGSTALKPVQVDNVGLMPASGDKAQQILRRDRGGAVVDQGKRGNAARPHTEDGVKLLGAAEREARRAEPAGELVQVDAPRLEHHGEPERPFFVFQKEALAVTARKAAAQRDSIGDGKHRRMAHGPMPDPEAIEMREQFVGGKRGLRHTSTMPTAAGPGKRGETGLAKHRTAAMMAAIGFAASCLAPARA